MQQTTKTVNSAMQNAEQVSASARAVCRIAVDIWRII